MPHPVLPVFGWVHTLGRCSCWVAGRAALHLGQHIPIHQGFYSILLKCHVGTSALHSGSCLLFFFFGKGFSAPAASLLAHSALSTIFNQGLIIPITLMRTHWHGATRSRGSGYEGDWWQGWE